MYNTTGARRHDLNVHGNDDDCFNSLDVMMAAVVLTTFTLISYQILGPWGVAVDGVVVLAGFVALVACGDVAVTRSFPFLRRPPPPAPGGRGGVYEGMGVAEILARFAPPVGQVSASAEPGIGAAAIAALPAAFAFKRDAQEGWAQCAICLGLMRVGESVRRLPACRHLFHTGCVDEWLRAHPTCPLCRAAVVCRARPELPV